MKTNYDFPYYFVDLRDSNASYVTHEFKDSIVYFSINLNGFDAIGGINVVLEVENTQTFYRELFVIEENNQVIEIAENQLGTRADYSILLVANQEGNLDLGGQADYYEYGDCVGILEKGSAEFEEDNGLSGLIKLAPTENDTITYDLTSDWLTIELPKNTYEKFFPWQKDEKSIPFSLASLGSGCIQYAILRALKDPEFKDKKWWEIISVLLEDKGYPVDDLADDDVPGATNKILDNCIQAMINAAVPEVDHEDTSTLS